MKTRPFVLCAIMVAALTWACAGSTPSSAVKAFYEAVSEGRTDDAIELLSEQTITQIGPDKLRMGIQASTQEMLSKGGVASLNVTEEAISGDVAQVTVVVKYGNGTEEFETIKLVKEKKGWRLQPDK